MRRHSCVFLLLISGCLYCQNKELDQFWNRYSFTKDLSHKWGLQADAGWTTSSSPENDQMFHYVTQVYIRGWAHYYPADRWKLSVSFAYYHNKHVAELNQEEAPEFRVAIQTAYNLYREKRLKISIRGRIEDRHIEKPEESLTESVQRFRFEIKGVYPINASEIKNKTLYGFVSDEAFFKTKSQVSGPDVFDRNRATIGLGYVLGSNMQIECSYVNEYLPRDGADQIVDVLQVNVTFHNLFPTLINKYIRPKTSMD